MADYSAWPTRTDTNLKLASAGVTLRAGATTAYQDEVIAAVVEETERFCRRTFLPSGAAVARYFDGSGTLEQEIDEVISVSAVALVNDAGTVVFTWSTSQWFLFTARPGDPLTRLGLARGAMATWDGRPTCGFPPGRRNVKVTGNWGYAAAIPEDLYDAVAGEAAARLTDEAVFAPAGRVDFTTVAGNSTRYNLGVPGTGSGRTREGERNATYSLDWHRHYRRVIARYRRGLGARLRRLFAPMV